jgi:N-acetylmuramoyl-L-alanine amidase
MLLPLGACSDNRIRQAAPTRSPSASSGPSVSPQSQPPSTTAPSPSRLSLSSAPGLLRIGASGAEVATSAGGSVVKRLRADVILPFYARRAGWAQVRTPCDERLWVRDSEVSGVADPQIVLDPGHGGDELGAQGTGGLTEKEVNLEVAQRAAGLLEEAGIRTASTRTSDYRATLNFRSAVGAATKPKALVSIHHNSVPDGPRARPGTETYFQYGVPRSKRLAGLIYEEAVAAIGQFPASWVGDTDAGAKWRLNGTGADYYAILRRPRQSGVTATLAELAFISNPSEESLLARSDVRTAEAQAIAKAVTRFLKTNEPGSGFTTPYPRTEPAGPGGGRQGCVDPS